jgi:double-stranded RNA-specific adenosine deaminase
MAMAMAMGGNHKGALNEYCAKKILRQPFYTVKGSGPPHSRIFVASVLVDDCQLFQGEPRKTIKDAEHSAAKVALEQLEELDVVSFGRKRSATRTRNYVGELHEYCSARRIPWSCNEKEDIRKVSGMPHCPKFVAKIDVGGQIFSGNPESNKQSAKQSAARIVLESLQSSSVSRGAHVMDHVSSDQLEKQSPVLDIELPVAPVQSRLKPRSALNELCQKFGIDLKVPITNDFGPPWIATFEIEGKIFTGQKLNKKDAIEQAAGNAYTWLVKTRHKTIRTKHTVVVVNGDGFADCVATSCHNLYHQLSLNVLCPPSSTDVVAAFLLEDETRDQLEIVSLASGSKCIRGVHLSDEGHAIQDCHAEIVARRAFVRFLYEELAKLSNAHAKCIFEKVEGSEVRMKSNYKVHLYISKPPCGDATQFTRSVLGGTRDLHDYSVDHQPCWNHYNTKTARKMGLLRKKLECGEGGVVLDDVQTGQHTQNWHKLKSSRFTLSSDSIENRLCTMSCSDKILKWNVLGVQGAPLSILVKPIYLSSVVIGDCDLFHHGHIVRGICCRFKSRLNSDVPSASQVKHPRLYSVNEPPSLDTYTDKTACVSLNWYKGSTDAEVVDTDTGLVKLPECLISEDQAPKRTKYTSNSDLSLLCKRSLFEQFHGAYEAIRGEEFPHCRYREAKQKAKQYQEKKKQLYDDFVQCGYGHWIGKPKEVDNFRL